MEKQIPIPYGLSQWDNMDKVFYKCPKCGCDMRLLGNIQNFCYKCGQEFDWEFCIEYVIKEIKEMYWDAEKDFYDGKIDINEMIKMRNDIMFEIYKFACNKRRKQGGNYGKVLQSK